MTSIKNLVLAVLAALVVSACGGAADPAPVTPPAEKVLTQPTEFTVAVNFGDGGPYGNPIDYATCWANGSDNTDWGCVYDNVPVSIAVTQVSPGQWEGTSVWGSLPVLNVGPHTVATKIVVLRDLNYGVMEMEFTLPDLGTWYITSYLTVEPECPGLHALPGRTTGPQYAHMSGVNQFEGIKFYVVARNPTDGCY